MATSTVPDTLSSIESGIAALPPCGLACLSKIPGFVTPLTVAAFGTICTNGESNLNMFTTCAGATCTNSTEANISTQTAFLLPDVCASLGFNNTGIVLPTTSLDVPLAGLVDPVSSDAGIMATESASVAALVATAVATVTPTATMATVMATATSAAKATAASTAAATAVTKTTVKSSAVTTATCFNMLSFAVAFLFAFL
ncbi:hypothetical protein HDU98_007243 [Podochytrium sp. JEL0797]|nr:hypothetical protein HDU98_007243 [Podochytrium sp. JEL0797]